MGGGQDDLAVEAHLRPELRPQPPGGVPGADTGSNSRLGMPIRSSSSQSQSREAMFTSWEVVALVYSFFIAPESR